LAHIECSGSWRQWFAETQIHPKRQPFRPFPEKPLILVTKDATPDMIQTYRDDWRGRMLDYVLQAALEGEQKAGARDASLGKDAHDFTVGQRLAGLPQGMDDGAWSGRAVDRNCLGPAQDQA